jgi:Protein of unknown function (DUF3105)
MRHGRFARLLAVGLAVGAVGAAPLIACGSAGSGAGGSTSSRSASGSGGATGSSSSSGSSPSAGSTTTSGSGGHATGGAGSSGTAGGGGTGGISGGGGSGGSGGAAETTTTLSPSAPPLPGESACTVVEVSNIPEPDFQHITPCTPITYATNPPSGGNHWPIWGAFAQYTTPLPREMYVHDLEHGAIVLSYNCPDACPDVVAALAMVFDGEVDPLCLSLGAGPAARMVLTPDPLLPTPIAASAWGATYTATCIDLPSLRQFTNDHYGHGREDFCTDGQNNQTMPLCADGG